MAGFIEQFMQSFLIALGAGFAGALLTIPRRRKEEKVWRESIEKGVRAILKDKIQKEYLTICASNRKYAKPYEKENVSNLYEAYVVLGGNGYVSKLYDSIMEKPVLRENDVLYKQTEGEKE